MMLDNPIPEMPRPVQPPGLGAESKIPDCLGGGCELEYWRGGVADITVVVVVGGGEYVVGCISTAR